LPSKKYWHASCNIQGMENKSSNSDRNVNQELQRFVQELLDDGFKASEISLILAEASAGLGLDVAPDPEVALAVVMEGVRNACLNRSESYQSECEIAEIEHERPADVTLH
jgi:hypothetical protein